MRRDCIGSSHEFRSATTALRQQPLPRDHAAHRHGRPALPVLQHRDGRGRRRQVLEAVCQTGRCRCSQAGAIRRCFQHQSTRRHGPEPVPISFAHRSLQSASAQTGRRSRTGLRARQRNLGKQRLLSGLRCASALRRTQRLQRSIDAPAMEGRRRFCSRDQRRDRHFLCDQRRNPRRSRGLDSRSGASASRLHQIHRWQHRRRRVHERAHLRRHGWRAQRL